MNDKRDEVSQVQDKPAEVWIKLLFFITAIAVALIAYMGDRFIVNQDKLIEETSKINGNLQVYGSRISRIEVDVKEVRGVVSNNSQRIYKLEGIR